MPTMIRTPYNGSPHSLFRQRDAGLGFRVVHCDAFDTEGIASIIARIRQRVGQHPLYLSIDIDVLDS